MLCFRNVPEAKNFLANRVRGASRFSSKLIFISQCRKLPVGGGGNW